MPKLKTRKDLKNIYAHIVKTLQVSVPNVEKELEEYRKLDIDSWSDRDFFGVLVRTVFAGIREDTIGKRWPAIKKAFSNFNFHKVAEYNEKNVQELLRNPKIIRNEGKIRAVIANAKKMEEIAKDNTSFLNYVKSFKNPDDLVTSLQEEFKYIGDINVYDFVKELGFPFIKPDRQIRKVFHRLGLIHKRASPEEIIKIGKSIAEAAKEKPAVVDWALWSFGSKICKANPECEKCRLTRLCNFYENKNRRG
jgi:3-methyladenine DNA glycosylase Tag